MGLLITPWLLLFSCASAWAEEYPAEKRRVYQDAAGAEHVYLVQELALEAGAAAGLFVYAHGAGGLEEQGMSPAGYQGSFKQLRTLLARERWIYVCPRQPDFASLMRELRGRYGKLPVVLAGASAGGRRVYEELERAPGEYQGVILLCPAVALGDGEPTGLAHVRVPVWIESGENDRRITASAQAMARFLAAHKRPYRYIEISEGNHDAPVKQAHWRAAFAFVTGGHH